MPAIGWCIPRMATRTANKVGVLWAAAKMVFAAAIFCCGFVCRNNFPFARMVRLSFRPLRNLIESLEIDSMSFAGRVAGLLLCGVAIAPLFAAPRGALAPPVTVTDDGPTYTLANGYLTVKVDKVTGDLVSVKTPKTVTPDVELMGFVSGHHAGYWEQRPAVAARRETKVTIDPASVNGERAEVSVKGWSDGKSILGGHPTAAGQEGGLIADLEIRYALGRGDHGLYTYAI